MIEFTLLSARFLGVIVAQPFVWCATFTTEICRQTWEAVSYAWNLPRETESARVLREEVEKRERQVAEAQERQRAHQKKLERKSVGAIVEGWDVKKDGPLEFRLTDTPADV